MQLLYLSSGLGGIVQAYKFTVTYLDLAGFTTAGAHAVTLIQDPGGNAFNPAQFQINQASMVLASRMNVTTAFTGGAMTAVTASLGTSTTVAAITAANSVFTTACFDKHGVNTEFNSNLAQLLQVNFIPTTDVLSNLTAGSVDIYIYLLQCSVPVLTVSNP
jgi:hypothetical protein